MFLELREDFFEANEMIILERNFSLVDRAPPELFLVRTRIFYEGFKGEKNENQLEKNRGTPKFALKEDKILY